MSFRAEFARALTNLAGRYADLGEWERALAAGREAADTWREQAAVDHGASRSDLADALVDLSILLGHLARWEEALASGEQAIGILRLQFAEQPTTESRRSLIAALIESVTPLLRLGRRDEAVLVATEAVATCQQPGAPDSAEGRYQLAGALVQLALSVEAAGDEKRAETYLRDAIGACEQPEGVRTKIQRAAAYNNLANLLRRDPRRVTEAYDCARKAWEIVAPIVEVHRTYRTQWEAVLRTVSICLLEMGRVSEAREWSNRSYEVCHALFSERPLVFREEYTGALNDLAICLVKEGQMDKARDLLYTATALVRRLAASRPDAFRPYLGTVLGNTAGLLAEMHLLWDAQQVSQEALMVTYELALTEPKAYSLEYAGFLTNHAHILAESGQVPAARQTATAALRVLYDIRSDPPPPGGIYEVLDILVGLLDALEMKAEAATARAWARRD